MSRNEQTVAADGGDPRHNDTIDTESESALKEELAALKAKQKTVDIPQMTLWFIELEKKLNEYEKLNKKLIIETAKYKDELKLANSNYQASLRSLGVVEDELAQKEHDYENQLKILRQEYNERAELLEDKFRTADDRRKALRIQNKKLLELHRAHKLGMENMRSVLAQASRVDVPQVDDREENSE